MKKIILRTAVALCAVAIGFGVYTYKHTHTISDLLAQNIEALAVLVKMDELDGGGGSAGGTTQYCYSPIGTMTGGSHNLCESGTTLSNDFPTSTTGKTIKTCQPTIWRAPIGAQ
ncbi:MAG: NVEALA domain-containing protein [Prevotellaceae bacterium]|jgi:hypothetical protein|nr:NVEALA domain-containing protein [Prevotellaceae bacterium]